VNARLEGNMGKLKFLWGIIFVLILLQVITLSYFLTGDRDESLSYGKAGVAAKVGSGDIPVDALVGRLISSYGEDVLTEMINRKLVLIEAERLDFTVSEGEIEQEISYLKKDYTTEEEFYQSLLEQAGISREELREEIKFYLLMEEMATKDVVIEENDMLTYYEENKSTFYVPTQFHIHKILVSTEQEAKRAIMEIEGGSSFEAVAAERSSDMLTATDGGDMGMVMADEAYLPAEVIQVAEEIPLNEISSPIKVEEGYQVIKISERIMGGQQSFDEVKSKIRRELALKEIDGISAYLENIKENIGVTNYLFEKDKDTHKNDGSPRE
jgi:foldase protein PrsA